MKEFHTRTIWGLLYATALMGAMLLGAFSFALLFFVLSVFVLREFYSLCRKTGFSPQVYLGLAAGSLVFVFSFLVAGHYLSGRSFLYILPLIYAIPVYELFRKKKTPIANMAITGFGLIYVSVPFSILNFLAFPSNEDGQAYTNVLLISLFIFVWASDSGAYFFGIQFGKHRLFERISPKKTWEGLLGGMITALLAAWVLTFVFPQYSFVLMGVMAIVTVISGTLGDLIESMFKRSIGLKDSGRFMPGHGGLLDRFDSILLASPTIFLVIQFFS